MEENLRFCYQRVREELGRAALRQKRYYDRKHYLNQYKRDDLVYKKKKANIEKLGDRWDGPVAVIDKLSDVTYRIQKSLGHKGEVVHHDLLKLHHPRTPEENDTSWIDKVVTKRSHRRKYVQDRMEEETPEDHKVYIRS